jgi:tripartite-type tricarboxylate transporter receptor subunit TctC
MIGTIRTFGLRPACQAVALVLFGATFAQAQTYPAQRLQILVPFSAGTVLDILARAASARFADDFRQPVIVVNRPGASGTLAFGDVTASQDGHTLIFSGQSPLTVQPHLKTDLPYRIDELAPVCQMFETPFALVVGPKSPFRDFAQFAAAARADPERLRFAHSGTATAPHLFGTLLERSGGFRMTGIPYRGLGDQIRDVIAGTVDATILSIGSYSRDSVRAIAVFNRKRSPFYPEVPTVEELGLSIPFRSINGLFAKHDLPTSAKARLQEACARAFASDEFRQAADRLGVNAELLAGPDFARALDRERQAMRSLISELGLGGK